MPPLIYITADKSTNHRVTNQVTVICPVVNGRREGIVLNAQSYALARIIAPVDKNNNLLLLYLFLKQKI